MRTEKERNMFSQMQSKNRFLWYKQLLQFVDPLHLEVLLLMGALILPICLSYVGLALFLYGFFLTRRELDLKASSKV